MSGVWTKAPRHMTEFNGLKCSVVIGKMEWGVFAERYSFLGCKWSVRQRPVDGKGEALNCWGQGIPFETKREAVAVVENAYTHAAIAGHKAGQLGA